ncbi:MAG: GTPase [Nostoc sp.]|uniref:GTPase family protein n=1 Tax=Nostoc sp. TaxID=1180 RepID=UPI002FFAA3C9
MTSNPEKEREQQITFLSETIKKYRHHLPKERKPSILICGKTGNGKTSTINALFGQEVGNVGDYGRGTDTDEVYEWESNDENINIVDLPGLGDSEKNDKVFQEIYRRRIKEADGFIVIVCPPRPAELGTLKTVNLLISSGVSSKHIIFGFNKLSYIRYRDNGKVSQVEIDGLIGSTSPKHTQVIGEAKKAFLETLREEIPGASFSEYQIIEYDSISGWNLHKMLSAVVEMLPYEAIAKLNRAREAAERQAIKKEKDRLKEEREFIRQEEERLKQANAQSLREQERLIQAAAQANAQSLWEQVLEEQRRRVEEREEEALAKLNRATEAERQARKKEKDRLKKERELIRQEEERLKQANAQSLREQEHLKQATAQATAQSLKKEKDILEEQKRRVEEREEAVENFSNQGKQFNTSIVDKILSGIETVITLIDPSVGATIGAARKVITSAGNVASNLWNAATSWFR